PDLTGAFDNDVSGGLHVIVNGDIGADDRIGADADVFADPRARTDNCSWMNHTMDWECGMRNAECGAFLPLSFRIPHSELFRSVRQRGGDYGLGHELAINVRLGSQLGEAQLVFEHGDFQAQLIARSNRFAEFRLLDAGEIEQLRFTVGDFAEKQHRAGLRHRFDDANAGENWRARKVTLEDLLVHGHVLDCDDPFERFQIEHAINQQHGVTVWDD